MNISDELKAKKAMKEDFVDQILEMLAEAEGGDGPSKIMIERNKLHKKCGKIIDSVTENIAIFDEKERTRRFINFFEEINKLFDEFMKAEGI